MTSAVMEHVLKLISAGLKLFPCVYGEKRPATPNGFKDAVGSIDEFKALVGNRQRFNVAAATGKVSGVTVIDIDPRHGGDETMRAFTERYGRLPETWTARTPLGGWHYWFCYIPGSRSLAGDHGVDIRSDGGYALVPPGTVKYEDGTIGAYRWIRAPWDVPLAEAPEWLAREIVRGQRKKPGGSGKDGGAGLGEASDLAALARGVEEGQRNAAAARLIGHLLAKGVDPFLTAELMRAWNERNSPPLPDSEIVSVITSISRREYEKRTNRAKRGRAS